jgi:cytoskeleton protein RodZ
MFSLSDQQPEVPTSEITIPQDNTVAIELRDDAAGLTDDAPEAVAATPEPADEPVAEAVTVVPAAQVPAAAAADEGELTLSLVFSGDCWTEISDGSGRRLYFDQGQDGRTVELSGVAPFNVLFGNASNVTLRVNGSAYDIGPADRLGRKRFTISGN